MPVSYSLRSQKRICTFDDVLAKSSKEEGKDQESVQSSITPDPRNHIGT